MVAPTVADQQLVDLHRVGVRLGHPVAIHGYLPFPEVVRTPCSVTGCRRRGRPCGRFRARFMVLLRRRGSSTWPVLPGCARRPRVHSRDLALASSEEAEDSGRAPVTAVVTEPGDDVPETQPARGRTMPDALGHQGVPRATIRAAACLESRNAASDPSVLTPAADTLTLAERETRVNHSTKIQQLYACLNACRVVDEMAVAPEQNGHDFEAENALAVTGNAPEFESRPAPGSIPPPGSTVTLPGLSEASVFVAGRNRSGAGIPRSAADGEFRHRRRPSDRCRAGR